jgi:RHH-type transcriptional regulator, proline utilization regulon repressor / proline dehydrogenase / delta 1-pyrroline-5-carboxylate dehydrogenase
MSANPFAAFRSEVLTQSPLRAAITAAYRRPEPECVPPLLELAALNPEQAEKVEALARSLVTKLRAKTRLSGVEGLIYEYSLSSQEGVALMCLAEANQRVAGRGVGNAQ